MSKWRIKLNSTACCKKISRVKQYQNIHTILSSILSINAAGTKINAKNDETFRFYFRIAKAFHSWVKGRGWGNCIRQLFRQVDSGLRLEKRVTVLQFICTDCETGTRSPLSPSHQNSSKANEQLGVFIF
jgi:hypothetical protein